MTPVATRIETQTGLDTTAAPLPRPEASVARPVPADPAARRAWDVAATVTDPEIPVLTIEDLGVLRSVSVDDDGHAVHVELTPTYSGCPAMDAMRDDVVLALTHAGYDHVDVRMVLAPAWTTDWMSDEGKQKLRTYGIQDRKSVV